MLVKIAMDVLYLIYLTENNFYYNIIYIKVIINRIAKICCEIKDNLIILTVKSFSLMNKKTTEIKIQCTKTIFREINYFHHISKFLKQFWTVIHMLL